MNLTTDIYRPIELYVLVRKSKVEFIEMILLVLCELLSKNVLAIDYHKARGRVEAGNIRVGINFKLYQADPIDRLFLYQFRENPDSIFNFQYVILRAIEKARSRNNMIRLATKSKHLEENLRNRVFFSQLGMVSLTKNGKRLSDQMGRELFAVEQRLDNLLKSPETNQKEILDLIRNRFYFLDTYDVKDIFGTQVYDILERYKTKYYDINYELSMPYLRRRLQLAHIEILKMNDKMKKYESETYEDSID